MTTADLKIAELLCTRLCHDLTGPIGAVNNGAEFLKEEGFDMQGQAVELIVSSATEAVNRLQYYRKAYGRINDDGEASLSDNKKITLDFFAGSKITIDWPDIHTDASGISVSRKLARLMLNMIIIASGSLIRGGSIAIRIQAVPPGADNVDKEIVILATGPVVKWDPEVEQTLSDKAHIDALTPKTVQSYMTRKLADELKVELRWDITATACNITARHHQGSFSF